MCLNLNLDIAHINVFKIKSTVFHSVPHKITSTISDESELHDSLPKNADYHKLLSTPNDIGLSGPSKCQRIKV